MRDMTNKIMEAVEEGLIDRDNLILACLSYMTEDDVAEMARLNELFLDEDDDDEDDLDDEDDGQPSWEQEWRDFGECYSDEYNEL